MKKSKYNFFIKNTSGALLYNSMSNAYILLNKKLASLYQETAINIKNSNNDLYSNLIDNKFIISDEIDEFNLVLNERMIRRFSNSVFEIIINPTLDCNLNCWYCYENHKANSVMSQLVRESIFLMLQKKMKQEPFIHLKVSFFGGEPLLQTQTVILPFLKELKKFQEEYNIILSLAFTTNGTIVTDNFLDEIRDIPTSFQITFDGTRELHNKIRYFKHTKEGSFDDILKNIERINNKLIDFRQTIRINYDHRTLEKIDSLFDKIKKICKIEKTEIQLQKVWQAPSEKIQKEHLYNIINYGKTIGLKVIELPLHKRNYVCYADNYNQLTINYDGNLFKCTARDFNKKNAIGKLLPNGLLQLDNNRLASIYTKIFSEICEDCKLLPSCPGICSQKVIEGNEQCIFGNSENLINKHIIQNFLNEYNKIKQDKEYEKA